MWDLSIEIDFVFDLKGLIFENTGCLFIRLLGDGLRL